MLLLYTTIFVASLSVALVARFIYKAVKNSKRSVYRSKERIHSNDKSAVRQKVMAASRAGAGARYSSDRRTPLTTQSYAGAYPAMPTVGSNQSNVWPYRQERSASVGKAYKVKRRVASRTSDADDRSKPWGW